VLNLIILILMDDYIHQVHQLPICSKRIPYNCITVIRDGQTSIRLSDSARISTTQPNTNLARFHDRLDIFHFLQLQSIKTCGTTVVIIS